MQTQRLADLNPAVYLLRLVQKDVAPARFPSFVHIFQQGCCIRKLCSDLKLLKFQVNNVCRFGQNLISDLLHDHGFTATSNARDDLNQVTVVEWTHLL